ncbi:MAG: hypothetical protein HYR66_02340 [Sphingobacteriales bacterium]|nr:hypothetical protein [Sphingobacteriales bacterium]MBI3720357.1 hypothetical protein [Sphingobacteriales bacterium]
MIENKTEPEEIIVKASYTINEKVAAVGKLNIEPMDLPQAVAVVGKEIQERQQVLHISDALQNVNVCTSWELPVVFRKKLQPEVLLSTVQIHLKMVFAIIMR